MLDEFVLHPDLGDPAERAKRITNAVRALTIVAESRDAEVQDTAGSDLYLLCVGDREPKFIAWVRRWGADSPQGQFHAWAELSLGALAIEDGLAAEAREHLERAQSEWTSPEVAYLPNRYLHQLNWLPGESVTRSIQCGDQVHELSRGAHLIVISSGYCGPCIVAMGHLADKPPSSAVNLIVIEERPSPVLDDQIARLKTRRRVDVVLASEGDELTQFGVASFPTYVSLTDGFVVYRGTDMSEALDALDPVE